MIMCCQLITLNHLNIFLCLFFSSFISPGPLVVLVVLLTLLIMITIAKDSVTTDEANGLFSVKSELSLTLTRQELEGYFECRVETPALDNLVRNQLHIDLQGK